MATLKGRPVSTTTARRVEVIVSHRPDTMPKAEAIKVLRRAGVAPETIQALESELDDPIDLVRDAAVFDRYGVGRNALINRMGGSP